MTASAKAIRVAPITRQDADALVKAVHYSGKVVRNSQLHLGVFLDGRLEGAMQFGPSLDKRKVQGLVSGTRWDGFLELNRLAFSDRLPRNSESRAISVAMRLLRQHYPQVEWVISFADATQCGDGTIYRAAGFTLTKITKNSTLWGGPNGEVIANATVNSSPLRGKGEVIAGVTLRKGAHILGESNGAASMKRYRAAGWAPLPGFQLRYIYFLNPAARARLTCEEVPFARIAEMRASMYLGVAREAGDGLAPPATAAERHRPPRSNP
jgi:hypothetical protein